MAIHIVNDKLEEGLQRLGLAQDVSVSKTRMALAVLQAAVDAFDRTGDCGGWTAGRQSSNGEPARDIPATTPPPEGAPDP